jgi:hypothetical protein
MSFDQLYGLLWAEQVLLKLNVDSPNPCHE